MFYGRQAMTFIEKRFRIALFDEMGVGYPWSLEAYHITTSNEALSSGSSGPIRATNRFQPTVSVHLEDITIAKILAILRKVLLEMYRSI
jgi:hypothetical protein